MRLSYGNHRNKSVRQIFDGRFGSVVPAWRKRGAISLSKPPLRLSSGSYVWAATVRASSQRLSGRWSTRYFGSPDCCGGFGCVGAVGCCGGFGRCGGVGCCGRVGGEGLGCGSLVVGGGLRALGFWSFCSAQRTWLYGLRSRRNSDGSGWLCTTSASFNFSTTGRRK